MRNLMLAFVLAGGLAGCCAFNPSSSSTAAPQLAGATSIQNSMCQTYRSYEGRGQDAEVKEACVRGLGPELCTRCLQR